MTGKRKILLSSIVILLVAIGLMLAIPPVRDWVFGHINDLLIKIGFAMSPPEEVVFVPGGTAFATMTPLPATFTPPPTKTATITLTPQSSPTVTPTSPPMPEAIALDGIKYIDQHGVWNYCGPANLAMMLSYWGRQDTREETAAYLKPFDLDLNVMPYEMVNYVADKTDLKAALRYGGDLEVVKRLVAGGYPVLLEKGVYFHETSTGINSWMGHYQVISGYDNVKKEFIAQDSYVRAGTTNDGRNYRQSFDAIYEEWRSFNFLFLVVYPPADEEKVMALLGDYNSETGADQIALQRASEEIYNLTGIQQYFAWFNRGTSLMRLQDYVGSAAAYDQAFTLYPSLPEDTRPWRMMWYQTGPYFAYYYSGRYYDVISLADSTLDFMEKRAARLNKEYWPYIEETFYWRGMAKVALGDLEGSIADLRKALEYHPGFIPAVDELNYLGITP
jgi:tetratricopeptide (TPR) repeat protein